METEIIEDEQFTSIDYQENLLKPFKYDSCIFKQCNFAQVDLNNYVFLDCTFIQCDFSNAIFNQTTLRDIEFDTCKLLGLAFQDCHPFLYSFSFKDCKLDYSTFNELTLKKMVFTNCSLVEVDFTACDLSESVFENCNLNRAVFHKTNLRKADFTTAIHFNIDVNFNQIKGAKFSQAGALTLLHQFAITIG